MLCDCEIPHVKYIGISSVKYVIDVYVFLCVCIYPSATFDIGWGPPHVHANPQSTGDGLGNEYGPQHLKLYNLPIFL